MSTITPAQHELDGMPALDRVLRDTADQASGRINYLPVRPLRRWLRDYVIRAGSILQAATELHVHDRTLWRILREQGWVTIAVADAILTAAGEPHTFAILYPLDDVPEPEPGPWVPGTESMFGDVAHERWCPWCSERVTTDHQACCPACRRLTQPLDDTRGVL